MSAERAILYGRYEMVLTFDITRDAPFYNVAQRVYLEIRMYRYRLRWDPNLIETAFEQRSTRSRKPIKKVSNFG